jgi:uncharacterized Zn-binding protein involved in type VI secretion
MDQKLILVGTILSEKNNMTELILKGEPMLNFGGDLNLVADGGKVTVDGKEVIVLNSGTKYAGIPVIIPPPPATPTDPGTDVKIITSLNATVTVENNLVVTMGITMQGNTPTWPGMVLPSTQNQMVMINNIPINVAGDSAITLPNAGSVTLSESGQ